MPTENRSSNTETKIQHPEGRRERFLKWVLATKHPVLGYLDGTWLARGDDREGYADKYVQGLWVAFKEFAQPPPQPHPDPIAWMVGTAFWWTKEEAERDAADTGLPIVGLGPMAGAAPAEQHQGKPAAWVRFRNGEPDYDGDACMIMNVPGDTLGDGDSWQSVYTHPAPADPAEVEQLLAVIDQQKSLIASLRAELVESYSIDASAEPSAPVEIDERVEFEQACREAAIARGRELDPEALRRRADGSHVNPLTECGWWGWQARAALGRKPQVKR